jgi:hypothetical protein
MTSCSHAPANASAGRPLAVPLDRAEARSVGVGPCQPGRCALGVSTSFVTFSVVEGEPGPDAAHRHNVDFQLARRRIEALTHHSSVIRARALAAYVGVFEFADEQGFVDASSEEIAAEFEIGRPSWLQYRAVLEEAGLVEVEAMKGGRRRGFRLLVPSPIQSDSSARP